jgi:hypothetical protein
MTEQEAFEAWAKTEGLESRLAPHPRIKGVYQDDYVDDLWDGWKARAAHAAILQAATRDEPDFDAAEATVILEDDQILAIEKMVADQIFKEGTQSRKNLTLRTVRTCINVASKPVATRDEPSALTTEVLETLDMFMSLYRAKGWEGDAAYERAEALIAARTPKESK